MLLSILKKFVRISNYYINTENVQIHMFKNYFIRHG